MGWSSVGRFSFLDFVLIPSTLPTTMFAPPWANVRVEAPTHTEDGVPIRKLYVSNFPPQTTRTELLKYFEPFGKIKNCWMKSDKDKRIKPYAFVTYVEPGYAHKALSANPSSFTMRGKALRVRPADSWHQPKTDACGNVMWKPKKIPVNQPGSSTEEVEEPAASNEEESITILDVLNPDCLLHIMSYISFHDLIRSEAVSTRWRDMVRDYFLLVRSYSTSSWTCGDLTTAKLRLLLQRMGATLKTLHIDDYGYSLNKRTVHTISKYCPNLETLTVDSLDVRYWNHIAHSCKKLNTLSFTACNEVDDDALSSLLSIESSIENLSIAAMDNVQGNFLKHITNKLTSLTIQSCRNMVEFNIRQSIECLKSLKILRLSKIPVFPITLKSFGILTNLEEFYLHTMHSFTYEMEKWCVCTELGEAVKCMPQLKILSLHRHRCFHDEFLMEVAKHNTKLKKLDISGISGTNTYTDDPQQVTSVAGIKAIATSCKELEHVNVSFNSSLNELVPALSLSSSLRYLEAMGGETLSDCMVKKCISKCYNLEVLDLFACESITADVITACIDSLEKYPRKMTLCLGETDAANSIAPIPEHPQLTVLFDSRKYFEDKLMQDIADGSYGGELYNFSGSGSDDDYDFDGSDMSFFEPDDEDLEDLWEAVDLPIELLQHFRFG